MFQLQKVMATRNAKFHGNLDPLFPEREYFMSARAFLLTESPNSWRKTSIGEEIKSLVNAANPALYRCPSNNLALATSPEIVFSFQFSVLAVTAQQPEN
jgi:hypothetical protein